MSWEHWELIGKIFVLGPRPWYYFSERKYWYIALSLCNLYCLFIYYFFLFHLVRTQLDSVQGSTPMMRWSEPVHVLAETECVLLVFLETLYSNSKSNSIQQHSTHHIDRHRCSGPGSGHDGLEYNDAGSGQFDMKTLITAHWLTGGRGRGGRVVSSYVSPSQFQFLWTQ